MESHHNSKHMKFPNITKELRETQGWSQKKVSALVGYKSLKMLSKVENGHVLPSSEKMIKFSQIFKKPVSEIFFI